MYNCVDPFRFIPKCIAHEIIEGDMYAAGTSVFLPNEIKMEPVLAEIRRFICLNGVDVFEKLLKVLRSEPTGIYKELADCMESMYHVSNYCQVFIENRAYSNLFYQVHWGWFLYP